MLYEQQKLRYPRPKDVGEQTQKYKGHREETAVWGVREGISDYNTVDG